MPKGVAQFVVAKQHPNSQAGFDASLNASANKPCVIFHGTDISNVASILHNGFNPAFASSTVGGGVYLAHEPGYSWAFATKWIQGPGGAVKKG